MVGFMQPTVPEDAEQRDIRLIREWKNSMGLAKDRKLTELLTAMQGVIGQAINTYRAAPLPQQVLELEGRRIAVGALEEWQPGAGAKPSTFVGTRVRQRLYRFVAEHQNTARIPEEHVRRIGGFQTALQDLTDRFGREPSTAELADHMGVPVAHVSRLRKMLRSDAYETELASVDDFKSDPEYDHAMLGYYSLTELEKSVFDHLTGAHGHIAISPSEIATKLKISRSQVSNLKASIGRKLSGYMKDAHG